MLNPINAFAGLFRRPPDSFCDRAGRLAAVFVIGFPVLSTQAARGDALQSYAQQCDEAIGVTVQDFDCDAGTEVPVTNLHGGPPMRAATCDRPNRLHGECDPGSKFQVLTRSADAYVVAHCRKQEHAAGQFGDIAVIQYSRKNGATCFYQALGDGLPGRVMAPSKGLQAWPWITPSGTAGIGCARCHDNGPFIRSPYLNQVTGPNALPGANQSSFNSNQPYAFVGRDFASWKTYKVEIAGNECNDCHRLGANNVASGQGTAMDFAIRATAASESAKNPPSIDSPIWMPPSPPQVSFDQAHADAAKAIHDCAARLQENPLPDTDACRITLFAEAYVPPPGLPKVSASLPGSPVVSLSRYPEQEEVFWPGANGDVSSTWRNDRVDNGSWHPQFGIALPSSVRSDSPMVVLSRFPQHEEVFWIGANGDVSSTWRNDNVDNGAWHSQFAIALPGSVRPGSPLVVLARTAQQTEVFWIGANGDVSSTWRNDTVDNGGWHPQFGIAVPGSVRADSPLVALSRFAEQEEVFWIGANGDVSSTWRNDAADNGSWHAQFGVAFPGSVRTGSSLVALSRSPQQEEVFWIGANGDVSSTWRNDAADNGSWHAQFAIALPGSARTDSPLVVLSRFAQQEEVFWIGANGDVSSTWRNDTVDNGGWHAQFGVALPASVRSDSSLVVLSRSPQQEEVFWTGANGDVSSNWRNDAVDNGGWHSQFGIALPGSARSASSLAALSRFPEQEEMFWIGANGDVSSNWRNDTVDNGGWHTQFGIALPGSVRPAL